MFITLRCQKCDNVECPIARAYVPYESNEGCTREVSQETYERWQHLMIETLPFLSLRRITSQVYADIDSLENEVYSSKLGRKLDYNGKALPESTHFSNHYLGNKREPEAACQEDKPNNENKSRSSLDILSL